MNKLSLSRRLLAGALDAASDHLAEIDDGPSMGAVLLALFAAGAAGCLAVYALGEIKRLRAEVAANRAATNAALEELGARGAGPSTPAGSSGAAPATAAN